eukprot:11933355-Karenia_brevis.AAC.1
MAQDDSWAEEVACKADVDHAAGCQKQREEDASCAQQVEGRGAHEPLMLLPDPVVPRDGGELQQAPMQI